eukprot:Skav231301  [mRNA]  locus=scaffold161:299897:304334:- [translate_table: standard]
MQVTSKGGRPSEAALEPSLGPPESKREKADKRSDKKERKERKEGERSEKSEKSKKIKKEKRKLEGENLEAGEKSQRASKGVTELGSSDSGSDSILKAPLTASLGALREYRDKQAAQAAHAKHGQGAGVQLNVFHCSAAIKAFHSSSGWSNALDFASTMNSWAIIPDDLVIAAALHSLANPFLASRGWAVAMATLGVPSWHWATRGVNPVISACSTCDEWRLASNVLHQMPALRAAPDTISYNSLCDSFAGEARWRGGNAVLCRMQEKALQSDVITFNSAINTCATAWVKVLHLVQDIERRNLQMNEKSCGASIKACVSKWRIAASLLEAVRGRALEMNAVIGHSVLAACGNRWQQALKQANKMQIDGSFDCKALVASIHGVSKAKCWTLPLSLFQLHQRDCHNRGSAIPSNAALAACGEGNLWAAGLKLFETIALKALVPDEVTWGTVTSSFEQGARWKHALRFLGKAMHVSVETGICCNSAASSCEKASHWQQALSLVSGHDPGNVGSIGFNAAITACENVGEWQWSLQVVSQLHRRQMATEVSCSEAAIAAAQASQWPMSLVLLGLCDGGAAWATSMGSAIEASGPQQRLQLLAKLGRSSMKFLWQTK